MIEKLELRLKDFIEEAQMEAEEIINPNSYAKGFADGIIETSQAFLTLLKTIKDHQ
jgi:hypothetical protein